MASIDYYEDSSQWGQYQYTTLEDIINNYLMSRDGDDYSAMTPRFKILYQAMRGLREFYYDVLQEVKATSLELSPSLTITLPPDFVNYVRISWLDDDGILHPMAMDNRMSIAKEYLQDHNYNILFDNDGNPLIGSDNLSSSGDSMSSSGSSCNNLCSPSFLPNADMSKSFTNGKYKIDKSRGIISFGSAVEGKEIVLEYISDGIFTGFEGRPEQDIRIHKFAESAVLDYIYYQLIKNRRNVPYNEKMRAKKEYYNSRRVSKMRINTIRKSELLQVFKGNSKWIK
jgi:hypothetical protein